MARKTATTPKARKTRPPARDDLVGKRIRIDHATWDAISLMAREQMKDLDEITEEAFRDLLKKNGRTADFREALKMSARQAAKNPASEKAGKTAGGKNPAKKSS